jgi:hypothetical protein
MEGTLIEGKEIDGMVMEGTGTDGSAAGNDGAAALDWGSWSELPLGFESSLSKK